MRRRAPRLRSRPQDLLDGCTVFNLITTLLIESRTPHARSALPLLCWALQGPQHTLHFASRVLERLGVRTCAYHLASEHTARLPTPFACVLRRAGDAAKLAVVVRRYTDGVAVQEGDGAIHDLSHREFAAAWDGIALVVEGAGDRAEIEALRSAEASARAQFDAHFGVREGFMSPAECDDIAHLVGARFTRSVVGDAREISTSRTSQSAYLSDLVAPLQAEIIERARALVGDSTLAFENLQVVRYGRGETYQCHYDVDVREPPARSSSFGYRAWTVLVYLSDDFEGGQTWFPIADKMVTARKGAALYFRNRTDDGQPNAFALHTGLPVRSGIKQAMNIWSK